MTVRRRSLRSRRKPRRRFVAATRDVAPAVSVQVNPTFQNTATATATASASAAIDAAWSAFYRGLDDLPQAQRDEARRDADELRKNIETRGDDGRLRELLGKALSRRTDIALKLLPVLIQYGPAILDRLRHMTG